MRLGISSASLLLIFSLAVPAFAVQTRNCGRNMKQVKDIMRSNFGRTFDDPDYAEKFVGTWSFNGKPYFTITSNQNFNFSGANYAICPQTDGTFYLYKVDDPTNENGQFRLVNGKLTIFGGQGMLSWAQGEYSR